MPGEKVMVLLLIFLWVILCYLVRFFGWLVWGFGALGFGVGGCCLFVCL